MVIWEETSSRQCRKVYLRVLCGSDGDMLKSQIEMNTMNVNIYEKRWKGRHKCCEKVNKVAV